MSAFLLLFILSLYLGSTEPIWEHAEKKHKLKAMALSFSPQEKMAKAVNEVCDFLFLFFFLFETACENSISLGETLFI